MSFESDASIGPEYLNLSRESGLTHEINQAITSGRWAKALDLGTDKYAPQLRLAQRLRKDDYQQPLIDVSPAVDQRIVEAFSPGLKTLLETGQSNPLAVFGIIEYFLRSGYQDLNAEQVTELAREFRPPAEGEVFEAYKAAVESAAGQTPLPGKDEFQSWVVRRELMDILEICHHLQAKYLNRVTHKTIFISDFIRIAANTLRMIHQADSSQGMEEIARQDGLLAAGTEITAWRDAYQETSQLLVAHPEITLPFFTSRDRRSLPEDFAHIFKFPDNISVEGLENLPGTGPALLAFPHINGWRDKNLPPNWEILKLLQTVAGRRSDTINLATYTSYHIDTAPPEQKSKIEQMVAKVLDQLVTVYNVRVLDVKIGSLSGTREFYSAALEALRRGELILIAPEAAPSLELLPAKRGIGTLARQSGALVVGTAFRENQDSSTGQFSHQVIFTPALSFGDFGSTANRDADHEFTNQIMHCIAQHLPQEQRGIYR